MLLIEDDDGHALLMRLMLAEVMPDARIDHVSDGEAALDRVRQVLAGGGAQRPDLVLLDLKLPKLDGRAVLDQMRHVSAMAQIPIIVVTTSSKQSDAELVEKYPRVGFLTKPIAPDRFIGELNRLEDRSATPPA